jgi:anaphase-promoting complex subunit 6
MLGHDSLWQSGTQPQKCVVGLKRAQTSANTISSGTKREQKKMAAFEQQSRVIMDGLRVKTKEAMDAGWNESAIWLAEKVVAMGAGQPKDVLMFASALFRTNQFSRALCALKRFGLENHSPACRLLASRCLFAMQEYQGCLALLQAPLDHPIIMTNSFVTSHNNDKNNHFNDNLFGNFGESESEASHNRTQSGIALLQGRVYDVLEHKDNASHWYRESLRLDPFNTEAFDRLVKGVLLTADEASNLLLELNLPSSPEHHWLLTMYTARLALLASGSNNAALPPTTTPIPTLLAQCHVTNSIDIMAEQATHALSHGDIATAFDLTQKVREFDSHHVGALIAHVCCLVELGNRNDLYLLAHTLTREQPSAAVGWFAVGCYYRLVQNPSRARTFFQKATSIDPGFATGFVFLSCCV